MTIVPSHTIRSNIAAFPHFNFHFHFDLPEPFEADSPSPRASGKSLILLTGHEGQLFDELLEEPDFTPKSARVFDTNKPKLSGSPSFELYPNPAADHVVLQFRNWDTIVDLQVIDGLGRTVLLQQVDTKKSSYLLDLSSLSSGSYSLNLISSESELMDKRSLEVIR